MIFFSEIDWVAGVSLEKPRDMLLLDQRDLDELRKAIGPEWSHQHLLNKWLDKAEFVLRTGGVRV